MRYKEYNPNRVLEKAIRLFWKKGFNGCSINEIVEETGVNRFSLYHEFENKEGILYRSLLLYRERYCNENLAILSEDMELESVLTKFYLSFLEKDELIPGCYFIHIGTELADTDNRVKDQVDEYLGEIENLIARLLLANDFEKTDANYLAGHLTALYCTVMSFCLVHSHQERLDYISNGINVILHSYAKSFR